MQEERDENNDNTGAASAASIDASSSHHSADTDDAQGIREDARDEELETENGNKVNSGGGYESLDPSEVEEARLRAQQRSVYARLQGDNLEDLYSRPTKRR